MLTSAWQRLVAGWVEFSAHFTWHQDQPEQYFRDSADCPGDFIECPWCHMRWEC